MKRSDKFIIVFYIFLGVSLSISLLFVESSFDELPVLDITPKPLHEIKFEKITNIPKEEIFNALTDVQNYPKILPKNILSIKIIDITNSTIIAEEELFERGLKTKFLVKHIIYPYEKHIIEIIDGDAKGTILTQTFVQNNSSTIILNEIKLNLQGKFLPFSLIPKANLIHALDSTITQFENYVKISNNPSKKLVDLLYREILFRSADEAGLNYYSSLLENNEITEEEIRFLLQNSEEKKSLFTPHDLKEIDELNEETKIMIDGLYQEVLERTADDYGLQYFGSLYESDKITSDEIRDELEHSEEKTILILNVGQKRFVDETFRHYLKRPATTEELDHYNLLLQNNTLSKKDFENLIKSSKYEN